MFKRPLPRSAPQESRVACSTNRRSLFRELAFSQVTDVPAVLAVASQIGDTKAALGGPARKSVNLESNSTKSKRDTARGQLRLGAGFLKHQALLPGCQYSCRYGCLGNISPAARIKINENFWQGDFTQKRLFLVRFNKSIPCATKTTNLPDELRKRHRSTRFFLPDIEGKKVRVCKTMFLHTLGLSSDARLKSFRRSLQSNSDTVCKDHRGGSRRVDKELHDTLDRHIESFHPQISHYNREHAPLRRYLEASLSIRKMHKHYLENCPYQRVTYETYRKKFQMKRITFVAPQPDLCDVCERAKQHFQHKHLPNEPACLECGKFALHPKFEGVARAK